VENSFQLLIKIRFSTYLEICGKKIKKLTRFSECFPPKKENKKINSTDSLSTGFFEYL
tara:strand:+ start:544 stop:717 length:174 start_codon:yes stop_codon:yes gene_type:complete